MCPRLTIVLPCYNPPINWAQQIIATWQVLEKQILDADLSLIVVNDGSRTPLSTDAILALKNAISGFKLVEYSNNQGKGHAVREGMRQAKGDYFIYTDIDFPFEIDSLLQIYNALQNGADVVCGIRQQYNEQLKPKRKFLSWGSHILNAWLLRLPFKDTQGGLKGFNQRGRAIFLSGQIKRYLFDTEFILRASKQKDIKLTPVTIFARPEIVLSEMNLNVLSKEFDNIFRLIKTRFLG
jgi:glycosyltransferase involved in cell wall biosynthesis